jgi:hypothetical protein
LPVGQLGFTGDATITIDTRPHAKMHLHALHGFESQQTGLRITHGNTLGRRTLDRIIGVE